MLKTGLFLSALTALFLTIGFMAGGKSGMMIALLFALVTNVGAYWFSDKMVLSLYQAQPLNPQQHGWLLASIRRMSVQAGIPEPKAYIMPSRQPNAFATGRNPAHGAVAVTQGLLNALNQREVEAVVAHELAHIKNRDTLIMTITATIAGAIGMLTQFMFFFGGSSRDDRPNPLLAILAMILAPLAAMVVQLAISRTREYGADAGGAEICGDPDALASALAKISSGAQLLDNRVAEDNPATAHMFIISPLHMHKADNLFATHPNVENRIRALRAMKGTTPPQHPVTTEEAPRIKRRGSFNFG